MSYTITVCVYQTNPNAYFHIVEKTVYNYANGGTWSESNGTQVLTMGGSGTSGTLRLVSDSGENCIIALGIHNNKRWGDIVTNLANDQTCVVIHPQYYTAGERANAREKQLASCSVSNAKGRKIAIDYVVAEGHDLKANIIIG